MTEGAQDKWTYFIMTEDGHNWRARAPMVLDVHANKERTTGLGTFYRATHTQAGRGKYKGFEVGGGAERT